MNTSDLNKVISELQDQLAKMEARALDSEALINNLKANVDGVSTWIEKNWKNDE